MALIRFLILEDDRDIIDLLRSILEPAHECFTAANGLEGLQQAIIGQPDMIICDIMMPVMDGKEFIKRLRTLPGYDRTPVIFLTALSSREQILEGYELGATLYLAKPLDPGRFKRTIEQFLVDRKVEAHAKRKRIDELAPMSILPQAAAGAAPRREAQRTQTPGDGRMERGPASEKMRKAGMIARQEQERHRKSDGGIRILIVDDDADTCRMIRSGLESRYEVLECGDGISAIEQAVRYKPDMFIIDGLLPRMTGYQLTMMLRKNREFFRSPIIFISGRASERDQQYAKRLGVTAFLAKPFSLKEIEQQIEKIQLDPGFQINRDRVDFKQVHLEHFQRIETHRKSSTQSMDQVERDHLERTLKRQLK